MDSSGAPPPPWPDLDHEPFFKMLSSLFERLLIALVNNRRDRARTDEGPSPTPGAVSLGRAQPLAPEADPWDAPRPVSLSLPERLRHTYVIGATGSGKTNLLLRLIEGDLAAGRSLVVVDLRGDLVDRVLPRLAAVREPEDWRGRLCLLDLRDESHVVPFNPLSGSGDAYSRALHVLSVIRRSAESWGVQLEETLRNALVALSERGWSLLEIEPLLSDAAFREAVLSEVADPYVKSFFARYGELSEERQVAWRLPVLNKVSPLLSHPRLRLLFGQRDSVDVRALLDAPGTVVLIALAADRLHGASHLAGGLLVSAIQNAAMARADVPEERRSPAMLYVDEFETMADDRFSSIVAEGRRFGVGLTLSHQNLAQLPQELRQVIRNNVGTQVLFRTGAVGAGELSREVAGGLSREEAAHLLMALPVGEAVLVRRGEESVRLQVPRSADPDVPRGRVAAIRAAAYAGFARSAADVAAEIGRREKTRGLGGPRPKRPDVEVRHGKRKTYHPDA